MGHERGLFFEVVGLELLVPLELHAADDGFFGDAKVSRSPPSNASASLWMSSKLPELERRRWDIARDLIGVVGRALPALDAGADRGGLHHLVAADEDFADRRGRRRLLGARGGRRETAGAEPAAEEEQNEIRLSRCGIIPPP